MIGGTVKSTAMQILKYGCLMTCTMGVNCGLHLSPWRGVAMSVGVTAGLLYMELVNREIKEDLR